MMFNLVIQPPSKPVYYSIFRGEIDRSFINYTFKEGTIFLRDVDSTPMLLNENDLK